MMHRMSVMLLVLATGLFAWLWSGMQWRGEGVPLSGVDQDSFVRSGHLPPAAFVSVDPDVERGRYLVELTLHSEEELGAVLQRLDDLARHTPLAPDQTSIALLLHGPEIEFFALPNYSRYRRLVDLAARLDAFRVIEVKACRTMMKEMQIGERQLPAFIEQVPYGPDELQRLLTAGFTRL